jgi:hypothetical protein
MDDAASEFRAAFPRIAAMVDATGEHRLEVTHSLADAAGEATVIVKRRDNARGWGLSWRGDELIGMRGHRYVAGASDAWPGNAEFIAELRRRLSIIGASLHAIEGGAGYMMACDDLAARSGSRKKRRAPSPYSEVREQLRARAF